MFYRNNDVAHTDLEQLEPVHTQKAGKTRSARISLLVLALLTGVGIVAMQVSSPAFAEDTDAAAKVQKQHKRELANPNTYVLKQKQTKIDSKASEAAALEKKKSDYAKLDKSVKALSKALKRESDKAGVDNTDVLALVELNSKEAGKYATAGAYDKALVALEHGYEALTAEIVKLENLKGQGEGAETNKALAAKPETVSIDPREAVEHEIKTNKALLDALKRQNEEKAGGKEDEIKEIKAAALEASTALDAGDVARAETLIHNANSRTKIAIASLQKAPSALSGIAAVEAQKHDHDTKAQEELRNDYAKRKETVEALLDAGKRVDSEHGTSHNEFARAGSMLRQADDLAAAGNFNEGKALLDRTYLLLKDTMRNMLSLKEEPKPAATRSPAAPKTKKKQVKTRTDAQQ